jgi:hypothetical protein
MIDAIKTTIKYEDGYTKIKLMVLSKGIITLGWDMNLHWSKSTIVLTYIGEKTTSEIDINNPFIDNTQYDDVGLEKLIEFYQGTGDIICSVNLGNIKLTPWKNQNSVLIENQNMWYVLDMPREVLAVQLAGLKATLDEAFSLLQT